MRGHDQRSDRQSAGRRSTSERGAVVQTAHAAPATIRTQEIDGLSPQAVMRLQRTAGNAAVAASLAAQRKRSDQQQPEQAEPHECGRSCHHRIEGADAHQPTVQRSAVHDALSAPGRPLDAPVRAEMESRMGTDFSDVRIHTGSAAHSASTELQAHAFTTGSHIVFQRDQYDPRSSAGKHTLAHELTHVVQQRSGPVAGTDNGQGLHVSDPSDAFERAAEDNARRVMSEVEPGERESDPDFAYSARPNRGTSQNAQRMFSKMKNALSGVGSQPEQMTLRVGDNDLPVTYEEDYYKHKTDYGGTAYIHFQEIQRDQHSGKLMMKPGELTDRVMQYLGGGLMLYRGVARWHPKWHDIVGNNTMPPMGAKEVPDFNTSKTSFIPFTPIQVIARGAALAAKGMGKSDFLEYVEGYTRSNPDFPVGLLATAMAGPDQDVGFLNAGEIQIRGPLSQFQVTDTFRMSTDTYKALSGTDEEQGVPISDYDRPSTPNDDQKRDFKDRHGRDDLLP